MNSLEKEQFQVLKQTMGLRNEFIDSLSDDDLSYTLPGNPSLGALCRAMGEIEQSYIQSFKEFKQDFSYQHDDTDVESSVSKLKAWYQKLDEELLAVLSNLPEEDIQGKLIDRGHNFMIPVTVQFHIYREALLIFYAKADVYRRAIGKSCSDQWTHWIS